MIHYMLILIKKIIQKLIDMVDEFDDKDGSIRKSDKLNYRDVIQNKINRYLDAIGTFDLEKRVRSLRNSVFFEIPGLPFRSEILEKEKRLRFERAVKIVYIVKSNRDEWIHPYKRAIHKATFDEEFYMELGEFLLDLIARHDGLMQVKGFVETGTERKKYKEEEDEDE